MTVLRYRQLLCLYLIVTAAWTMAAAMSSATADPVVAGGTLRWLEDHPALLYCILLLLLALFLAGLIGLFLLQRWGRTLSLWMTIAMLPLTWWLGGSLYTGLEEMLATASNLLWGAILALAFCPPMHARFEQAKPRHPASPG